MNNDIFFDLHVHATFKKYLTLFEENFPTSRTIEDLVGKIDTKNPITDVLDDEILHILESQSSIEQIKNGRMTIGVAGIAAVEKLFTEKEGLFGKILNSRFFTNPLDQKYMNQVRKGGISYYQLFIKEIDLYRKLNEAQKITLLSRLNKTDLDNATGIHIALSMEGGHALIRTKVGNLNQIDVMKCNNDEDTFYKDFKDNPILNPAESLRHLQQALWNEKMDLFSLTLTHLSHIPEHFLATHAYGMKMLKNEACYPDGNGISEKGFQVIDMAYNLKVKVGDEQNGMSYQAPVLIDIKHMGLKSRLDFYQYRKEKGYTLPILASHMGVTGYSIAEWKNSIEEAYILKEPVPNVGITIKRKKAGNWGIINQAFTYNAWSINMMDEDIEEVINSKGLIGIILDVRILGWQDIISKGDKEEFLSVSDFRFFFPDLYHRISGEKDQIESFIAPTKEERHPLALCFNILHVASVGYLRTNVNPWQHICMGSDFDGLINPIKNCREASDFPALEENLLRWLPVAEVAYRNENGGPSLLPKDKNGSVDYVGLKKLVRDILFNNGKDFMQKWMDDSFKSPSSKHKKITQLHNN